MNITSAQLARMVRGDARRAAAVASQSGRRVGVGRHEPLVIKLPLPPRELHPNARPHRMAKAQATKAYRGAAFACALEALGRSLPPLWERAKATCMFFLPTHHRHDEDNIRAWMKAGFDGLADAGVVANDRGLVHAHPGQFTDKARPCVVVTIEPIAEGEDHGQ